MKDTILALLKTKFEGVSDAILGRIADKLAKTAITEDDAKKAVEGVTVQQLLESYGDSRASEAQQTAVKNYEAKHNLKDGKPVDLDLDKNKDTDQDSPAWAKELLTAFKTQTSRLEALETKQVADVRRKQITDAVAGLPKSMQAVYLRQSVEGTDEEFGERLKTVQTEIEGIKTDIKSKGAMFGAPYVAGQHNDDELSQAQIDAISKREGGTAQGQPF